jgi:BlaI family transcriptional regulator, penicillinase repressor
MADRISDAEYAVMEVLWRESPLTAADIAERVDAGRDWSVRTVKTLLSRLLSKGVLAHEEDGRRYLYRPTVARDAYVDHESKKFIDRMFGGKLTPLVAHFAEREALTSEDIAEIEALLKALKS